jgi:16S rRNA (uracil1498-N3)-methyltransferase
MRRFFVDPTAVSEGRVTILGQDAFHINKVLRLDVGDVISVSNSVDTVYEVKLTEVTKDRVVGEVTAVEIIEPETVRLTVFQGLPKGKKMDFIVEKLTEIGAAAIVPVTMARSVAEYDGTRGAKKLERWRAIALEAAKQSKRDTVPGVSEIVSFKAAGAMMAGFDKVIVPWEEEAEDGIRIPEVAISGDVALVIGPEGGMEKAEVDALMGSNTAVVTLGKTILRTETASIVAAALVIHHARA